MLPSQPKGEDGFSSLEHSAQAATIPEGAQQEGQTQQAPAVDWLNLVKLATVQSEEYNSNATRATRERVYKAFRNEYFQDSKYRSKEFAGRSKIFRPKTRTAVRRDMAATAATLFSTINAIDCSAGDEADPIQNANAELMQELVKYRTSRTSGKAAFPWFLVAMGSRQDAVLTGICASKQHWRFELKPGGIEQVQVLDEETGQPMFDELSGEPVMEEQDVFLIDFNRPDVVLIPTENLRFDPAADWTNIAQTAAYIIIKWPMRLDQIRQKQKDPYRPWKEYSDSQLQAATSQTATQAAATRTAREGGQDRYDQNRAGKNGHWDTVWVYEVFMSVNGEDMTFFSVEDRHLLTDPAPVEEVYPWNFGERPIAIGYGSLESHTVLPMSPAESWQQIQQEINDLANLRLDTVKQIVSPISKVKKGKGVELNKIKERAPNTILLLQDPEKDVIWDRPPEVPGSSYKEMEYLNNDFDTLAGQFDQGSVQTNRSLNETVGGLKMISGAANAMQEFDQRLWIETWAEPVIAQVVRLEQYYEDDQIILGLCGKRAEVMQKYGVNEITDQLLEQQVIVQIDVGLGVGDPMQRLQKFGTASKMAMDLLKGHPKFASGEYELDADMILQECYGPAGYRDGGQRFIKKGKPKQNPAAALEVEQLKADVIDTLADADKKHAEATAKTAEVQLKRADLMRQFMVDGRAEHQQQTENKFRAADMVGQRQERQEDRRISQQNANEDRAIKREGQQAKAQEKKALPAPKQESPQQPKTNPLEALMQQLQGAISAPRQRRIQFQRGQDGLLEGALIEFTDGGPGPQAQIARFQRGPNGEIAGADIQDIAEGAM